MSARGAHDTTLSHNETVSQDHGADEGNPAAAGFQTPALDGGGRSQRNQRSRFSLTQSRHTRVLEKNELVNLNDRLAAYIDRVRELETQNTRLRQHIQTRNEAQARELTSLRDAYERELADARRATDLAAEEKAKLRLEAQAWQADAEALQTKLTKQEQDCSTAELRVTTLGSQVADLQGCLKLALAQLKDGESDRDDLAKELDEGKKRLQNQLLCATDLSKKVETLNGQLNLQKSLYEKELEEARVSKEEEITQIEGRIKEDYERQMTDMLPEFRQLYESDMQLYWDKMDGIYETKMRDVQDQLARHFSTSSVTLDELRTYKTCLEAVNLRIADLESLNQSLSSRARDLEQMVEQERDLHTRALGTKEEEMQWRRDEIKKQLAEYGNLLELKVSLELEIASYRKLLEVEETRLNITPCPRSVGGSEMFVTLNRGSMRTGVFMWHPAEQSNADAQVTASAKGDIEVSGHCIAGRYVIVHNKGTKEVLLGRWRVHSKAGSDEFTFQFKGTYQINPGASVTIWSPDCGGTHNPPAHLVMRSTKWPKGEKMRTALITPDGKEVAYRETCLQQLSRLTERSSDIGDASGREPVLENDVAPCGFGPSGSI